MEAPNTRLLAVGGLFTVLLCLVMRMYVVRKAEVLSQQPPAEVLQPTSRAAEPQWAAFHDTLAGEVSAAKAAGGVLDIVFYGDSISESFRGSVAGTVVEGYSGNMAAWREMMGTRRAMVLGIAGDQTMHLLWRLRNGEGPKGLNSKIVTAMIGTNDMIYLTFLYPDDDQRVIAAIVSKVQRCVRELQQQSPQASIVLFGLLPLQRTRTDWPHAEYNGKVAATNQQLQAFVQQQGSEELKFKDCGGDFLLANATVDLRLMPDGIHPAGDGARVLLSCMLQALGD
ncbi:hypothetical protein CHLNCDRAFT_55501 [Chlorella variabilis]|uniref:SGNH hydrolase-type esterase domain-containing protein n=1 Tax=Chlorella variabilis TaxID=554065 RepID=E1ZTI1_CHLVA|nr:hypothetical protein CHLNCDRAFT_55501 [Chlorella variabilis]EFN50813.1 hypothetical protein CHLNCDRAFT_55501 [Chlorella variabilis]|eukprot:XP_005842915.1 hypothetical protein CHLNCDRAFT_55501 [Chlorella variabilis]